MDIEFNGMIFPGWIIGAVIIFILLIIQVHRKQSWPYIFCLVVFSVYALKALDLIFFPLAINGAYAEAMRAVPIQSFINLIPFYVGMQHVVNDRDLVDFINNILLTIPFGFGVIFISRLRAKDFLWIPLAIGFGIESAQLLISLILRYPYRVIDINDALLNAFGVLVGYALFRIFAQLFILVSPHLKGIPEEWLGYLDQVARRA